MGEVRPEYVVRGDLRSVERVERLPELPQVSTPVVGPSPAGRCQVDAQCVVTMCLKFLSHGAADPPQAPGYRDWCHGPRSPSPRGGACSCASSSASSCRSADAAESRMVVLRVAPVRGMTLGARLSSQARHTRCELTPRLAAISAKPGRRRGICAEKSLPPTGKDAKKA